MAKEFDFKGLAADLLSQSIALLQKWLPDGRTEGKEWVATNPTRADSAPGSFKVCVRTGKWSDFAVGESGGDLISLYAYLRGLKAGEAYKELTGEHAGELAYTRNKDNARPKAFQETVEPLPVPEDAGEMPRPPGRRPAAEYTDPETGEELYPTTIYRNYKGHPIYRVVTTRSKTGNKYPIPTSYCRWVREQEVWNKEKSCFEKTGKILDTTGWNQKDWPDHIPLCGLDYLIRRPEAPVLVVEGEKTWASVVSRLPEYAAVTWRGGTHRVGAADWSALRDRTVIICPDYDAVGQKAALKIANILKRQANHVKICWESLAAGIHEPSWDMADEPDIDRLRDYVKKTAVFLSTVEAMIQEEKDIESSESVTIDSYNALLGTISGEMLDEQTDLRCLGYGGDGRVYFICRQRGIVLALSSNQLASLDYLLALAPLRFWYELFPNPKGGFNKHECADTLQRWADAKGYFNPDVVRGAGVWVERDGSHVLHMGQKLLVDKTLYDINEYQSEYMYEATSNLGVRQVKPLSTEDAQKLVDICEELDWDCPVYGKLLAGFSAIAPMCGGLDWRPHIWVTGPAGSGKTTVISKILHKVCGKLSLFVQGDSSAAGIRQRLGSDALPVIFDEFEGENPKRLDELQKTLDLARQASSESGALMLKGSAFGDAVEFKIRSSFAFSAINVNIQHYADASRITVLTLKDPKLRLLSEEEKQGRIEQYAAYEAKLRDTFTPEYVNALQIRTFYLLPVIKKNARIFGDAVQKLLSSARYGDQLGILCAAAYSLQNSSVIDEEEAAKWVQAQDWTLSTPPADQRDHDDCLSRMLQYLLRPQENNHYVERSVGEMMAMVFMGEGAEVSRELVKEYDNTLKRYGFKVSREEGVVYIANSHSKLKEIMMHTPYQTWSRLLLRLDGAKAAGSVRFSQGTVTRSVSIPQEVVMAGAIERPEAAF